MVAKLQSVLLFLLVFMLVRSQSLNLICVEFSTEQAPPSCSNVVTFHQLEDLSLDISDNTVVHFNSGKITLHHLIHFSLATNLSLFSDQGSTILCNNSTNSTTSGFQFSNISNLSVKNLKFVGCGAVHNGTTQRIGPCLLHCKDTVDFRSTLFVQDCINVTLTDVHVKDGDGTGMAMFDTVGEVTITNCTFENNFVRSNFPDEFPGGGGVYVEFTYCPPGTSHDECTHEIKTNNNDSIYTFENCKFSQNNATTLNPAQTSYTASVGINFQGMGRGGGLSVIFKGSAINNSIRLLDCNFSNNWATWGGGLYAVFQDNSSKNLVSVSSSQFSDNICYIHGGGAVGIGHLLFRDAQANNNKFVFSDVLMSHNRADFGGGVVVYCGHSTVGNLNNEAEFHNCTWIENSAKFGSAVDVTADSWEVKTNTFLVEPLFKDCYFIRNFVLNEFIDNDPNNIQIGEGAFKSSRFLIKFVGTHIFEGNNGSAMHLTSSVINVEPGSYVHFIQNSGLAGGAISLIGVSAIKVNDDSIFVFINNTASSVGGAVYYFSIDNHNFLSSRSCFIHYKGLKNITERNVTFQFEENKIENKIEQAGQSVFASSLIPCMKECNAFDSEQFTSPFSCVGNFTFKDARNEIATKGAKFHNTSPLPFRAIPGKSTSLPLQFQDDLNQTVRAKCSITVRSNCSGCNNSSTFSFTEIFQKTFFGVPGEYVKLSIEAIGFREVKYSVPVLLEECPPGYVMNKSQGKPRCICSSDLTNKFHEGIDKCNHRKFRAYIKRGYWAGYHQGDNETENSLVTGYCPFCLYKEPRVLLADNASRELLDKVCVGNRTGTLCGECKKNYSIMFHSDKFECYLTGHTCKYGLVLYVLSELLPVTVFFIFTLVFNISFTSGAVNGFILFSQLLVNMQLDADGLIHRPDSTRLFLQSIGLIYKIFNLDFFSISELSFCIWEGAGSLDILAMKYVTITYSLALVLLTILILHICGSAKTCKIISLITNVKGGPKTKRSDSFIHGLSSFFVMCYAQCATVSVFILTPGSIISRSDSDLSPYYVVLYNGEVGYFQSSHLPYAIPALFFLVIVVIIPPALLIVYPLCYKLFSMLKIKEGKVITLCTIFPLEKLKPLFDSFQSCFKDKFRFFAGLYFLYRLAIPVTSVLSSTIVFYVYVQLELVLMLVLHSLFHPYKIKWHNRMDSVLLFLLSIINGMTLWNYVLSTGIFIQNYNHLTDTVSSVQAALIFLPLLCIVIYFSSKMFAKLIAKILARLKRHNGHVSDANQSLTLSFLDRRLLDNDN